MAFKTLGLISFLGFLQSGLWVFPAIAQSLNSTEQTDFTQICQFAKTPTPPTVAIPSTIAIPLSSPRVVPRRVIGPTQNPGNLILHSAGDYFNQGEDYFFEENFKSAIAVYSRALRLNPYDFRIYDRRADALLAIGDRTAALDDYDQAIAYAPPNSTFVRQERASLRLQLQNWRGANEDLTLLIEASKRGGYRASSYLYRDRCIARFALGDKPGAIADYREFRKQIPRPKPPKPATKPTRRTRFVTPIPPPVEIAPLRRPRRLVVPPPIGLDVLPIPTTKPEPEPTTTRGYFERGLRRLNGYSREGWLGAVSDFVEVTQREPNFAAAYYYLGVTRLRLGKPLEAIAEFNQVLKIDPTFVEVHYTRGIAYAVQAIYLQDKDAVLLAIADFEQLVQQFPVEKKAYAMQSAADLYLRNDAKVAQQTIDSMIWNLKLTPAEAYLNRAKAFEVLTLPNPAIADYTRVIELDPQNAIAYRNRGNLQNQAGNCTAAQTDWQKANELNQLQYQRALQDYKRRSRNSAVLYPLLPPTPSVDFCTPAQTLSNPEN